jgi:hypothetical protein
MLTLLISFVNVYSVGFEVLIASVIKKSIFCNISPYSPLKANQRFRVIFRFLLQSRKIIQTRNSINQIANSVSFYFLLAYSSFLKVQAKYSSETSVDFQRTTRHYILEDRILRYLSCLLFL